MKNYMNRKNLILLLLLSVTACNEKDSLNNRIENSKEIISLVEDLQSLPSNKIKSIEPENVSNQDENTSTPISDIQFFLTGVWSFYAFVDKERDLSWGTVPINDDYVIFDFLADTPIFIHGYSEGGPSFDHLIGLIDNITKNGNTVSIRYKRILSWQPFSSDDIHYFDIANISDSTLDNTSEELVIILDIQNDKIYFDAEMSLGYNLELEFIRLSEPIY